MNRSDAEMLSAILENRIAQINICLPAKVISYDYKTRKAKVQPLIKETNYTEDEVSGEIIPDNISLPIIENVPVSQGGNSRRKVGIHTPVLEGDKCWLIFSQKSLEEYLQNGEESAPDDPRINDLTDAWAILDAEPFSAGSIAENNTDLFVVNGASKIVIKPGGDVEMTAPIVKINGDLEVSGTTKLTGEVTAEGGAAVTGNVEITGEMKSLTAVIGLKDFATHTHSGVTPGGGNSGPVT